jgi:serine/threonine-protein kinase
LASDGTVKLTDFGIAKFFGGTSLTLAGSLIGTPDYMSPEQVEGQPATPRSDLYALGCVLYALLTGKPPFTGASVTSVMDRVRSETPRSVRLLAPQTPQVLDDIIGQLLRKIPGQRIATPQLLANLLQAMTHALSVQDGAGAGGLDGSSGETTVVGDIGEALAAETAGASQGRAPPCDATAEDPPLDSGEITVPTAISKDPQADARMGETVDYAVEPQSADVAAAGGKTHFTPVSEREWRSVISMDADTAPTQRERLSVAVCAAALLAIVGTLLLLLLPPSADKLYRRIQESAAAPAERARCSRLIDEFLERYVDDPRVGEIRQLQADLQCLNLQQELAAKIRTLTELEQAYLEGMRLADQEQWSQASQRFEQVVEELTSRVLSAADRRLLDRARHMRDKLQRHLQ